MFFNLISQRNLALAKVYIIVTLIVFFTPTFNLSASPGAHGPNGEHLTTRTKTQVSSNPKFESFTETFELVGELLEGQLVIYLHDFKSNTPVENASIELELGDLAASATYSPELQAYTTNNSAFINAINQIGMHDIVLTIMTESNGDLLVASLETPVEPLNENAHDDEHHDVVWWMLGLGLIAFLVGFVIGRMNKEHN